MRARRRNGAEGADGRDEDRNEKTTNDRVGLPQAAGPARRSRRGDQAAVSRAAA
jgi:hypothetical protein